MENMRPVGVNGYALRVAAVEVAARMPALIDHEHALAPFGQLVRRDRAKQSCANYKEVIFALHLVYLAGVCDTPLLVLRIHVAGVLQNAPTISYPIPS